MQEEIIRFEELGEMDFYETVPEFSQTPAIDN